MILNCTLLIVGGSEGLGYTEARRVGQNSRRDLFFYPLFLSDDCGTQGTDNISMFCRVPGKEELQEH